MWVDNVSGSHLSQVPVPRVPHSRTGPIWSEQKEKQISLTQLSVGAPLLPVPYTFEKEETSTVFHKWSRQGRIKWGWLALFLCKRFSSNGIVHYSNDAVLGTHIPVV